MASIPSIPAPPVWGARLRAALRWLVPPVGELRFWLVQVGLLTLAGLDAFVDEMRADLDHVPPSITISLLLVPVVYAALNFGVRGAVVTALWATALSVPHWMLIPRIGPAHDWTELAFLVVLNAVAVVVGQRVERERRARQRAEDALRAAEVATARYQSLFEDQPAPVIIVDGAGAVAEVNGAAAGLFGAPAAHRHVEDLLGATVTDLLDGTAGCVRIPGRDGQELLFVPTARALPGAVGAGGAAGTGPVQVVLADVTAQQRRQEEQRLFAARLLRVQEEERRRLARELHDDPLQDLTYLTRALDDLSQHPRLPVELADPLRQGGALAGGAATALRKLIHGLRPPALDDFGVAAALNQLAEQVRRRGGMTVDVQVTGVPARLDPEVELAAYRIAQEALNNVLKHAGATRVGIELHHDDHAVILSVADDGHGLAGASPDRGPAGEDGTVRDGSRGLGLLGMRERVNMVGGTLQVAPRLPRGTLVRALLPIRG